MLHAILAEPLDVGLPGRSILFMNQIDVVTEWVNVVRLEQAATLLQPLLKSLAFQQTCTDACVLFTCVPMQ